MLILEQTSSSNSFYEQFEKSLNSVYISEEEEYDATAEERKKVRERIISAYFADMSSEPPKPKLIRKPTVTYEKVVRHSIKQIKNHKA